MSTTAHDVPVRGVRIGGSQENRYSEVLAALHAAETRVAHLESLLQQTTQTCAIVEAQLATRQAELRALSESFGVLRNAMPEYVLNALRSAFGSGEHNAE